MVTIVLAASPTQRAPTSDQRRRPTTRRNSSREKPPSASSLTGCLGLCWRRFGTILRSPRNCETAASGIALEAADPAVEASDQARAHGLGEVVALALEALEDRAQGRELRERRAEP